jgi:hypothetical protein
MRPAGPAGPQRAALPPAGAAGPPLARAAALLLLLPFLPLLLALAALNHLLLRHQEPGALRVGGPWRPGGSRTAAGWATAVH